MASSFTRAQSLARTGAIAGALEAADAALEIAAQGLDGFEPELRAVRACCLLDRGDVAGAGATLCLPSLDRWAGLSLLAMYPEGVGYVELAAGRAREAREAFEQAGAILAATGTPNPAVCAWRSGAALAAHALGDGRAATAYAAEEVERARAFGAPRALGIALRAQGLVTGGDDGLDKLHEAVEVLSGSGARLEHTRALVDLGAAKRRAGRRREAREDLKRALDGAVACDAPGLAERAREELAAAGGRPRRERLEGPEALTPAERRVAEMAAEGMSNPAIAQALFVSRKTVESQLRSVFMKLDVSSRNELPERLR